MPLLNNLVTFSVQSTAENALNKLKRAQIPVFTCKKSGVYFIFKVKSEFCKKVFAIFSKPCYNVYVKCDSTAIRLLKLLLQRVGLFVGGIIFIVCCLIANNSVLKITVSGSVYLENQVRAIAYELGICEYSPYSDKNVKQAIARITAIPEVVFCSVSKRGSVLNFDVQTNSDGAQGVGYAPLVSTIKGRVKSVTAFSGTPLVAVGDGVDRNTPLIGAFSIINEVKTPCLAVGFAVIERSVTLVYFADCESEDNAKLALAGALAYGEAVVSSEYSVAPVEGGVNYTVESVLEYTLSINLP